MAFALFFLAEYCHIIFMSLLFVLLFLGGWLPFPLFITDFELINPSLILALKTSLLIFWFIKNMRFNVKTLILYFFTKINYF
jgi:NADH:ubiquinone oxidoreductase subunit H